MESEKHKYCIYCGEKISADAEKCEHCGNWFERSSVSRNHIQNNYVSKDNLKEDNDLKNGNTNDIHINDIGDKSESFSESNSVNNYNKKNFPEYSNILPIRRLLLLMAFTLGLYSFYWVYKTNCYLRDDLGKDVSPGIRTFLMIIPIANILVFYQTLEDMSQFIKQEKIESSYSSGLNVLTLIFSNFLPFIGVVLSFWVYTNVQESINEFWRIKQSNLPVRREFSNSEILVMILGAIFWLVFFIFYIGFLAYAGSMV